MGEPLQPVTVDPGAGTMIQGPAGGPLTFKVRGEQTGGPSDRVRERRRPGDGPPLHTHANEDESWYVLEGRLRFELGGELPDAPQGSFVFVPRGVPHCFQNVGDGPARILVAFTPSGMEAFFDRFAELPDGPADPAVFARLGRDLGMHVLGPPLAVSDPL